MHTHVPDSHAQHVASHPVWPLFALGAAGALIASPYLLPAIGIGTAETASDVLNQYHAHEGLGGSGLAGLIAGGLEKIPGIGTSLAAGGWTTILASGAIGLGGVLLANWLEKGELPSDFPWSKVIRYGSLATSMLISLPSLLTGIGVSIAFLSTFFVSQASTFNALIGGLTSTIGTASMASMGSSGGNVVAAMLPHILGCGSSLIPLSLAYFMGGKTPSPHASHDATSAPTYHCQLAAPCNPARGVPCEVAFRLTTPDGRALTESELAIVHTRPLHTMIVDSSLRDYHHLHPTYDPARQCFVAHFTPGLQTSYRMWNDFTVKGESAPTYVNTPLAAMRGPNLPPRVMHSHEASSDGVTVSIRPDTPLRAGGHHTLTLDIRDASGQPVIDLEPIMGAYAHLVAFSADGQHFLHIHPLGPEPVSDTARGGSPLHFHVMPQVDGPTQFFLQVQRGGRIITLPFGQMVGQAQGHEQRVGMAHGQHAMAMA